MKSNKTCPICLEEISGKKNVIQLQCKHTFHEECIEEYFKHIGKKSCHCPLCRVKFNELHLKDKKPLKWILRNRIDIDHEYTNNKIIILLRRYISNPLKNNDIIDEILDEIKNYLKHISNNYFLKKSNKEHILNHLKIITNYILAFLPLYKKKNKKKNKIIKSNFVYLLSKLESRKYVNKNILNKIYRAIK